MQWDTIYSKGLKVNNEYKTIPYQPTGREFSKEIQLQLNCIKTAQRVLADEYRTLERMQEDCPHEHKIKWTNNDGYGQFIVERCEDCGLQRDGGI